MTDLGLAEAAGNWPEKTMRAERVLKLGLSLGEGALWDPDAARLYFVDITGKKVFVYDPAAGSLRDYVVPEHVGTVVPRQSGGLMLALGRGFAALDLGSGRIESMAQVEAGNPDVRMNDGKCDPAGRFWAGSMPYDHKAPRGNLWRLDPDHSVHHMLGGVIISNGLVWTSDHKMMYYIDTPTGHIDAFDYDLTTGAIVNRRTAASREANWGGFDGMTIDAADTLWVAMYGGGCVRHIDPKTGRCLETVQVPGAKNVTSCAFGGNDLQDLYITTAAQSTQPLDQPQAGDVFCVRVNGARGVPALAYRG